MKTAKEVLEYLQMEGLNLHNLIGEDNSEFNKGRLYVMDNILKSLNLMVVDINSDKCEHKNFETWNHGYHSRCKDCGEYDVV